MTNLQTLTTFHSVQFQVLADRHQRTHLLKLVGDVFGFLVSLEPHHVLGVEPPRLLLERLRRQILRLCSLRRKKTGFSFCSLFAPFTSEWVVLGIDTDADAKTNRNRWILTSMTKESPLSSLLFSFGLIWGTHEASRLDVPPCSKR